jgi:acyl-coenzyme A synthetase/AMP-(fatty) acid ligase
MPSEDSRGCGGHILYTSGTTGASKKILWDGDLEDTRSLARSRIYGFDQTAVVHNQGFGLWTGTGWKFGLPVWYAGGCLVLDQRREKFKMFFRNKITFANMTTAVFKSLVAEADDWGGCQIWVGGAATAADLIDRAIAKFGRNIHLHYTSTETLSYVLSSRVTCSDDVLWLQPAPDRILQIVDEAGAECLPGEEGDLRILVSQLDAQGYLDDHESTARFFRNGFFYPGDKAIKRADGRIRILGRTGDVLNIHGEKLAIAPIEQRIQDYLQVDEACVFSKQNDAGQDELVIAVQAEKDPPKEKLDQLREEFKMFEKVSISILREFPRTRTGLEKVDRMALRQLLS